MSSYRRISPAQTTVRIRIASAMQFARPLSGKAIWKPDLNFVQLPAEQFRSAVQQSGISANVADLVLEMCGAMISGHMKALEQRSARNTTPTSIETFVKDTFLPAYQGKAASA